MFDQSNNKLVKITMTMMLVILFTSCYTNRQVVGKGAQTKQEIIAKNHYFFCGLSTAKVSNPWTLANGAKDFEIETKHTFSDVVWSLVTFGFYTPTTTIISK